LTPSNLCGILGIEKVEEVSDTDYQKMWEKLRVEFRFLRSNEVKAVDPTILIAYMGYIEEIEILKEGEVEKEA